MTSDDLNRRKKVMELLREGTNEKMLKDGTNKALPVIQNAYDEAWKKPQVHGPWRQLTAYRLAHLKLRRAADGDVQVLEEINRLFVQATEDDFLGPAPHIFRLPVLFRLKNLSTDSPTQHIHDPDIRQTLQSAKDVMRQLSWRAPPKPEDRNNWQGGLVNMLELSTYFMCVPYAIEGLVGPYADLLLGDETWFLVGNRIGQDNHRYPRELAERELNALQSSFPDSLLFKLPRGSERPSWKMSRANAWEDAPTNHVELLAKIALSKSIDSSDSKARQDVKRLRDELQRRTGRIREKTILKTKRNVPYRLADDLVVFGISNRSI